MNISALIVGIVGVTLDQLHNDYSDVKFPKYSYECGWYSAWGVFCSPHCPNMFRPFRNQTCESFKEPNFGTVCVTGSKVYCCSMESQNDKSWSGIYTNVFDGSTIKCRFDSKRVAANGDCGSLFCTMETYNPAVTGFYTIRNDKAVVTKNPDNLNPYSPCDQVKIFGAYGTAGFGQIDFKAKSTNRPIALWIKTGL
ncbi:hypothetical protein Ddc_12147 [Ditylenchus destructor]|nr:hypothetical protein Ddc_12147 [Ditylenchus destructor]